MKILLDTCAIAELRKPKPDAAVVAAVRAVPDEKLYLSVLSVGEIAKGIALLPAGKKQIKLAAWLAALEREFSERILPIDIEIARMWGDLTANARKAGRVVAPTDGLIASTALRHDLRVMTRNEKDFHPTGVRVVNPWGV